MNGSSRQQKGFGFNFLERVDKMSLNDDIIFLQ
jgi:hypothetical protein